MHENTSLLPYTKFKTREHTNACANIHTPTAANAVTSKETVEEMRIRTLLIDISMSYRYTKIHRSCRIHNFRQKNTHTCMRRQTHVHSHTYTHTRSSSHSEEAVEENANKNCVYVSGNTKQQTHNEWCAFSA